MSDETNEAERLRARELRDSLVQFSIDHELHQHGGSPCIGNRVGLIAFFAHSLGLNLWHLDSIGVALLEYTLEHEQLPDDADGGIYVHDHPQI